MKKNTKIIMTKLENRYTILFWWIAFMLITPWDQEKIVVVNLIVFVYFLHYMISASVEDTFDQRKQAIRNVVTKQLNFKLETLNSVINEVRVLVNKYDVLILAIVARLTSYSLLSTKKSTAGLSFSTIYSALNSQLDNSAKSAISIQLNKNLFSSCLLINDLKPAEEPEYK